VFSLLLEPVKTLLLAALVFIPFERLAAERSTQPVFRRGWAIDAFTAILNGLLVYVALLVVLGRVDAAAAVGAPHLRGWVSARPLWAQVVLALAVGDLGIYSIHRLAHTIPWLWRFHAVHHSAEEMDWLVAVRNHPIDLLLFRLAAIAPLVALNISPAALAAFIAILGWQSWLAHANVRLPYGPLRWVLVSPEFHHWHHAAEREAHDRNYANVFACLDVLFGTVHLPAERQPLRYGIEDRMPAGWFGRFAHPFRARESKLAAPTDQKQTAAIDAEAAEIAEIVLSS
jgi:sterol desaturase/sphingolipid hydroxylase (fatty acid hydroxylase superfamily)